METQVVTPEASAVEKMEEVEEMTGKASLGEVHEVEDGHTKRAENFGSSGSTEELEAIQSPNNGVEILNKKGQAGNSESGSFLESPSLAKNPSEEIIRASQEIEDEDTPVLIHTEGLKNGSHIQKEQTGEVVEATGDANNGNTTNATGKEAEMSFDNARDVSKEQSDGVNIGENHPTVPITTSSYDIDLQEGKAEDGSEAVLDDIEQKSDALFDDKQSKTVENSGEVTDNKKEEDELVTSSLLDITKGKNSSEESDLHSIEHNVVDNVEGKAYDKEEITDNGLESPIPVKLQEEEIECKEKSAILDSTVEGHETIHPTEEMNNTEKEENENAEHVLESLPEKTNFQHQNEDVENSFPITEDTGGFQYSKAEEKWSPDNLSSRSLEEESVAPIESQEESNDENTIEPETQDMNIIDLTEGDDIKEEKLPEQSEIDKAEMEQKDIHEQAHEEVPEDVIPPSGRALEEPDIVERQDDEESGSKEEDYTVKDLIAVSNGKQEENESVKENDVAQNPKEEMNEELLFIGDEHNEKLDKEEDITIEEPSTEASEDKNEVIEGLENAGPEKDTGEPTIEEDNVSEYSRTSIEKEATEDSHEEDKVNEGPKIFGADMHIEQSILEEAVVLDHSTMTNGEEPIKNDQGEDKEIIIGEDKDTDKHIIYDDAIQDHSKATRYEEPLKDGHKEEETRDSDISSAAKDTKEPTVEEELLEDGHDEKKIEGSQIVGAEDPGENIIEEGGHSEITNVRKPFEDGQEEEKVTKELETTGVDKEIKEPLIEELVVSDHPTATVEDKPVEDGHEESKVTEELQSVGEEDTGDAIIEKGNGLDPSETALTEEPIIDGHNKEKESKDIDEPILEEAVPSHSASTSPVESVEKSYEEVIDKDFEKAINVEDVVHDTSKTNIGEIKDNDNKDKDTEQREIVSVDKGISEPTTEEIVQNHSTPIVNDEAVEDNQEEEVSGGSEISGANKEFGETIEEGDALPDHSEMNNAKEKIEEDFGEEKTTEDPDIVNANTTVEPITKEVDISNYSEKTFEEEPNKDVNEDDKETKELEIVDVDKSIREPIKEVVSDHPTTVDDSESVEDSHGEKVSRGSELADTDKDIQENVEEEKVVPDYSETTIVDEQNKEDYSEEKVIEDQEIADSDKKIEEPITGEVNTSDSSTTIVEDSHEESKVTGGSQIASDETIGETSIEKDSVPAYSEITLKDESRKDGHDDIKATEKMEILCEENSVSEPIIEVIAPNHSTYISDNEPDEDSHEEKVSGGLETDAADKDIEDIVEEVDVVDSKTIKEEQTEEEHNEEKVNNEQEIATVGKDINESITEEASFPDYTTTITEDHPEESKVTGDSQIAAIEDRGEDVTEKEISADESKTATREVPLKDGHEEEMAKEEREIIGADETATNTILEEIGLDHSGTFTDNDSSKDSIEESKVSEESQKVGAEKNIGETTRNSGSTIGEEINEENHEEEKDVADIEKDGADKDINEPIIEEVVDPTYSTKIAEDDPIESPPSIQVIRELEIVEDASTTGLSTVSDNGEITEECPQEDKIEPTKNEVEAKESELYMDSTSEEQASTEKVERVDLVEKEEEHKIHDVDSVIETTEGENVPKDTSEDLSDTTNGLNFEAADTREEIEKVNVEDGEDLYKMQETDESNETIEQEENHKESGELLEGTPSLAPLVSEEPIIEDIVEEDKSINEEIVESQIIPSDDSDITQQVLEDPVNEIADDIPEEKEIPKEGVHNVELVEIDKEPEITTSQPQEEKTMGDETTLVRSSETNSLKLEGTDKSDPTELMEQKNIELVPEVEGQDQIHPRVVEPSTITSAQNEEVYAEPAMDDILEDTESAKERGPILEEVISEHDVEEPINVSHEEDKKDSSKPGGEAVHVSEILEARGASSNIEEHSIEEKEAEHQIIQGSIDDKSVEEQAPRELSAESGTVYLEGQLIKGSSQQAEVYKELEPVAARDDVENLTIETEHTKVNSQEADGEETLGEEATDSDSVSAKERDLSTLEEEEPKNSHDVFVATEIPVEEKASTERSDELNTSTESLVSEETMGTIKNHEQVIDDNVSDNILGEETLVADGVEQKHSEIPVETSDVVTKSVNTDTESIPETTVGISEEEPQETSTTEMKEKTRNESAIEDEIEDKMEASLKSERNRDENSQVEEPVKIEEDPELVVGGTGQNISISESKPLKLVSEPQVPDVVLDREVSTETDEVKDDNILETSNNETTITGVNRDTDGLEQNATLTQNVKAVNPCEEFPTDAKSADQAQCHKALPETENTIFTKDEEITNERDAVSAEDNTVEKSIQEEKNENKNNEEVDTYLDARDQKLDEPMSLEKPSDLASQIPTFNNEKTDQDSALVEKNVEVDTYLDAEDQNLDEPMNLEKLSDLVSQTPTFNDEKIDQDSAEVETKVEDIIESEIPVDNTEDSCEKDQKNVEAGIPRELIMPTELACQEKIIDNVPIAPSLGEETSVGDFGDGSAEESLQEERRDVTKNVVCEARDDETNKLNEGTAITESETSPDEVPERLESASDIQNNERKILGEPEAPKKSLLATSSDNAYIESLKEGEENEDHINEEAAKLVNDEQVSESNAENSTRDDTYEAKAPKDVILNQEVPEGSEDSVADHNIETQMIEEEGVLEEPNTAAGEESSVQLTQQGEDIEGAGAEEVSTTSEPEKGVESVNDDSSKTNETSKDEIVHDMVINHDVVFAEEDAINQEDVTNRAVTSIVEGDQKAPSEKEPMQVDEHLEESVYAHNEQTHETISKSSDAEDACVPESFMEPEKPVDSETVAMPMSASDNSPIEEEFQTDNTSFSSLTEASHEQIQEKEGKSTKDEEKQEMTYIKKGTREESGEKTEREVPLVETSSEGMKTNEVHIQEKSSANEEGEPQLLLPPETPDEPNQKQISMEEELVKRTDEKSSVNTDFSSFPIDVTEKSLQKDEVDDGKHGDALRHDLKVNDQQYEPDKGMNTSDETNADFKSSEVGSSLSDLLVKSSNRSLQTYGQSEEGNPPDYKKLSSNKELTIETKHDEKTDQKEKDEEGEEDEDDDDDEHKKDDSGSDAPVMVEASKDIDMKTTPKKSHGILHGVGSKVKHSISKVKKAITGKSSPHKQSSPKS